MKTSGAIDLPALLQKHEADVLTAWIAELASSSGRQSRISEAELRAQCREFLSLLLRALPRSSGEDLGRPEWLPVRDFLSDVSRSRALQGYTPTETSTFVFSLKRPLFNQFREELIDQPEALADAIWTTTALLDQLGLYTAEVFLKAREDVIIRQQQELLELSTPVVTLWNGILALPIIGTLDSARTQTVMESLLEKIVATGSQIAIIDITGVPTVDTLTAQHLLKTVTAARLMGADCILSGIRPQIAQTIVHLGVDLGDIITKASLADAFRIALKRTGGTFVRTDKD